MKYLAQFTLLLFGSYFLQNYMPWWSMVALAFLLGFVFSTVKSRYSFYVGFFAIAVLYATVGWWADNANQGVFAEKMKTVLGESATLTLIVLPALIGGIMGGLGSLSGSLLRNVFAQNQRSI